MQCLRSFEPIHTLSRSRYLSYSAYRALPPPPDRPSGKLDPSGRTPGFARRRPPPQQQPSSSSPSPSPPPFPSKNTKVADALGQISSDNTNNLLAPVHIPEDQNGVLKTSHPASSILANSSIVVQRQLEMMNVLMGFEQANRYIMMDSTGNHIGYLAEKEHGLGNAVARQAFRTHRSFTTHVFDKHEKEVLRFHRPFSWISSRIKVYDAASPRVSSYSSSTALQGTSAGSITNETSASISSLAISDMRIIGEAQQQWAPLRRKYNLFLHRNLSEPTTHSNSPQLGPPLSDSKALQISELDAEGFGFTQFAYVNEPFLSWDFSLLSEKEELIGSVNRNFAGLAREIFTDTGVYALRMDSAGLAAEPRHLISQTSQHAQSRQAEQNAATAMTLDQRAVMLATAVSIDFDYFSRHSGAGGGGWMPLWFPWAGGAGEAAGAEAGAAGASGPVAGEAGAAEGAAAETGLSETERAARGAQEAAKGYGSGEGAIAGAGTMAGYEAMQRGRGQSTTAQEQQPTAQQPTERQNDDDDWGGGGSGGGREGGVNGDEEGVEGGDGDDEGFLDLDDFF